MKSKKNMVLKSASFIIMILSIIIIIFNTNSMKTLPTFKAIDKNLTINEDFNGDGKKDVLYIKTDSSEYLIQVNLNNDDSLSLDPSKDLSTLGEHKTYWPMRLTVKDISRDNLKEIFTQSSFNETPIQHLFIFDNNKYENIFSAKNNILGFLDDSNGKTPKVISGNFQNGTMILKSYLLVNKELKEYAYSYPSNFVGNNCVSEFINLIESFPYEDLDVPDYFSSNISYNSITSLYTIANNNHVYKLQDCFFKDISYDEKNEPYEFSWTLNFKGIDESDKNKIKNFTVDLIVTKSNVASPNFDYKITSLDISF